MSKEKAFNNWQEVIVDFFENRIIKSDLYKARKYIEEKETKIQKEKNIKKQEGLTKKIIEKQAELSQLRKDAPSTKIRDWIQSSLTQKEKNNTERIPKKIAKGSRIIKTTHVLKFTHSSASNGGILLEKKSNDFILSTASFKRKITLDLAHNNGNLISISRFLGLELNGKLIIDCILQNDFDFLMSFKENEKQLKEWQENIINLIEIEEEREIKTADKAKQLYFPLNNDLKEYHLITPLFASSLCNEVDTVINNLKYKEQAEINEYRNHKKDNKKSPQYHQSLYVDYTNLAVQNFGGEHAKNVSMLNANRSGKVYLFSTQPPTWKSQLKPPISKITVFDNYRYSANTKENIKYLVDFLQRFENIDLSIKDPKKLEWVERWVGYIIDDFLYFVSTIHTLSSGWSAEKNVKLKIEHQYLLDPYRKDEEFQANKKDTDWQVVIIADFSTWLNKQLKNQDKKFTSQSEYSKIWKKIMEQELREYSQIITADNGKNNE
jgi:CRISPR-associated protein Csy1